MAGWYNNDWEYRKSVNILNTQVTANLTSFPVLISNGTDTDFASKVQTNGEDILFTDTDGTTKLDHEIQKYDDTTGVLIAWVKVPNLSSTANTVIFMYYGYGSAPNQENPTGVWDSNFKAVWHLQDDFLDSTSNSNDGTNSGSSDGAGKIGDAQDFDGVNDRIHFSSSLGIITGAVWTIEFWIKPNSPNNDERIFLQGENADDQRFGALWSNAHVEFYQVTGSTQAPMDAATGTVTDDGSTWTHIVWTYNAGADST